MTESLLDDAAAVRRSKLVDAVNVTLAEVRVAEAKLAETKEKHEKAVRDASSLVGMAEAELAKVRRSYGRALDALLRRLPAMKEPHLPTVAHELSPNGYLEKEDA